MREPDHTRRVVITGLGIVSPIGNDAATAWSSLTQMKSGLDRITHWDPTPYAPYVVAGEVRNFDPAAWLDAKLLHIEGKELCCCIEAWAWRVTPLKRIAGDEHQVVAGSIRSDDCICSLTIRIRSCRSF